MQHPGLLAAAAVLLVIGFLLMRWASRYDVTGLAADAAWRVAKNRGRIDVKAEAADMLNENFGHIRDDAERIGYARAAAKHGAGFLLAKFVGIAGIVMILLGLGAGAAAFLI
jgi:hypothetical protein